MLDEMKVMKRARPAVRKIAQDAAVELRCCRNHVKGKCLTLTTRCDSSSWSWVRIIKHGLYAGGAPAKLCTAASTATWTRMLRHAWSQAFFKGSPLRKSLTTLAARGQGMPRHSSRWGVHWQGVGRAIMWGTLPFWTPLCAAPPFCSSSDSFCFFALVFCLFCCCADVASSDLGGAAASRGVARASWKLTCAELLFWQEPPKREREQVSRNVEPLAGFFLISVCFRPAL